MIEPGSTRSVLHDAKDAVIVSTQSKLLYVQGDTGSLEMDISTQAARFGMGHVFVDAEGENALKAGSDDPVKVDSRWRLLGIVIGSICLTIICFVYSTSMRAPLPYGRATRPRSSFPTSGNLIWFDSPATTWADEYLPIGNGLLGAMLSGGVSQESIVLNIESLWSGGPFANKSYNGGNHPLSDRPYLATSLNDIRKSIFSAPSGTISNISVLSEDAGEYGSYALAGTIIISRNATYQSLKYRRWLDMDRGVVSSSWNEGDLSVLRESFCSHPAQACIHRQRMGPKTSAEPTVYTLTAPVGLSTPNFSCQDNATLVMRSTAGSPGMTYEIGLRVFFASTDSNVACTIGSHGRSATIIVINSTDSWVAWTGGTNYDINAGDAAHGFSFQGPDPDIYVQRIIRSVTPSGNLTAGDSKYSALYEEHLLDFKDVMAIGSFSLNLGQKPDLTKTTASLMTKYRSTSSNAGSPYIEWLAFNLGRYLLAASARGRLPANLQGIWAKDTLNPWSADYHVNINVQQAYWSAESTDLDVTRSLWDYMSKTWVPRGSETALTLYDTTAGFVVHNEINIFGHTGMKSGDPNSAQWFNYPAAASWMMMHVWDHYDYGLASLSWWKNQGYPLIKGVAEFWLQNLLEDKYFKDGTLVVAPCNSPEQVPITFGCAHWQQLIWELFNYVLKGHSDAGEGDMKFIESVRTVLSRLDRGLHIGSFGQLQEWKVDMDSPTDTHRHLSHLTGLYPGYSIASYDSKDVPPNVNLTKEQLLDAATTSLIHRGNGTGWDADSGWEKVWRSACWAQLGNADKFYYELTYAVKRNFGDNLLSLYDPGSSDPIFQYDANGAYPGAVMNALIQAPDVATLQSTLVVTLLPALPSTWSTGSLTGARVRGGIRADLAWSKGNITRATLTFDRARLSRPVEIIYRGQVLNTVTAQPGQVLDLL